MCSPWQTCRPKGPYITANPNELEIYPLKLREFFGLDEMAGFLFAKMGVYSRKSAWAFSWRECVRRDG